MGKQNGLLEQGFADAIQRAGVGKYHRRSTCRSDSALPSEMPPSDDGIVLECLEYYRANQELIDAAVRGAMDFMQTTHGPAYVRALAGSFASTQHNPLSTQLAAEILARKEFSGLQSAAQTKGLQAMGIGVAAGADFLFWGGLAGAEVLFEFHESNFLQSRTWHGRAGEILDAAFAGMELSFWNDLPLTGCVAGALVDVSIGLFFIRFQHLRQRADTGTKFEHAGWSLTFPLGTTFPLPFGIGGYIAHQTAHERTKRAAFSVTNQATGGNTISVGTSTTLDVEVGNTSGENKSLAAGATMALGMPSYFTEEEIQAMSISLEGWTFSNDGTTLTLTLDADTTWLANDSISFDITSVETEGDIGSGTIEDGFVVLTFNTNESGTVPIVLSAELDAAWAVFTAQLDCTITVDDDGFTLTGVCAGETTCIQNVSGSSQNDSTVSVTAVTTATLDGQTWNLGYQYEYGTNSDGTHYAQVRAAMINTEESYLVPGNYYYGQWVKQGTAAPNNTSTAQYKGTNGNTSVSLTATNWASS